MDKSRVLKGIYKNCFNCSTKFYVHPYLIETRQFCTRKCQLSNPSFQSKRLGKLRTALVGKPRSEEVKSKIGEKNKLNMLTLWKDNEYRDKQIKSRLFTTQSPETIEKRISQFTGVNHWCWKGDKASYRSLHKWVERSLGKANHCENNSNHISSRYHWANISGEYKRILDDWKQKCPKCNRNDGVKIHKRFLKGGYQYFTT